MRKPNPDPVLSRYQSKVKELWGKAEVLATVPVLANMEVGEIALGDGTETAGGYTLDALYFKPDDAKILVFATDGTNVNIRSITA